MAVVDAVECAAVVGALPLEGISSLAIGNISYTYGMNHRKQYK